MPETDEPDQAEQPTPPPGQRYELIFTAEAEVTKASDQPKEKK